jgi:rhodanese-related sulfurtransferase
MKNLFFILSILVSTLTFAQQKVESNAYNSMLKGLLKHNVEEVSAIEAAIMEDVVFLDSREKNEFEVSHIKDAKWIGYDTFDLENVKEVPKDAKIIVYCSVGARSENVSNKLKEAGYTNVSNMYGGIFEWVNQDLPIYRSGEETKKVHAYDQEWGVWVTKGEKVFNP